MINEGDRIAVGLSGGKDSLTMLSVLAALKRYYPVPFELEAVTLDLGFGKINSEYLQSFCSNLDVKLTVEKTLIGKIVFDIRKEDNPCSMCANLRRGALNNVAVSLGCNKVALGHTRDDVIETFLLSTFYEGRLHTFSPVTHLARKDIYVIRPLIYTQEREIKGYINKNGITPVKNPCPSDKQSKRQDIRKLITTLSSENKTLKGNIFGAVKRSGIDGWRYI